MGILDFITGKKPAPAAKEQAAAETQKAAPPPAAAPAPASQTTVYEVKSGDTLWNIAETFYGHGNGAKYTQIFEANKDQLKDPDSIQPGQKLKIPAAGAAPSASAPKHTAAGEWKPPQEVQNKTASTEGVEWKPPEEIS